MRNILDGMLRLEGVMAGLVVGKDGLVVASTLDDMDDAEVLAAMSAAVYGEINKSARRIGIGKLVDAIIDGQLGTMLLLEARDLILVVVVQRGTNLGFVKLEMRRAAKRIAEVVPS